ncbi:MAG: metal-binding protein [Agathobacter sp.]|nr:metal-binding protein [Agathobacter sp.]
MKNSYRFFENKECKYYPCHNGQQNINCMFCFCPLYEMEKCPGNYRYIESNGKRIKDCMDCTFPHVPENYDSIMFLLAQK